MRKISLFLGLTFSLPGLASEHKVADYVTAHGGEVVAIPYINSSGQYATNIHAITQHGSSHLQAVKQSSTVYTTSATIQTNNGVTYFGTGVVQQNSSISHSGVFTKGNHSISVETSRNLNTETPTTNVNITTQRGGNLSMDIDGKNSDLGLYTTNTEIKTTKGINYTGTGYVQYLTAYHYNDPNPSLTTLYWGHDGDITSPNNSVHVTTMNLAENDLDNNYGFVDTTRTVTKGENEHSSEKQATNIRTTGDHYFHYTGTTHVIGDQDSSVTYKTKLRIAHENGTVSAEGGQGKLKVSEVNGTVSVDGSIHAIYDDNP